MRTTPRDAEHVKLDVVHAKIKPKNRADILRFLAAKIAPSIFYTEDELLSPLENAMQDAAMGEGVALPFIALPRLAKPFSVIVTLESAIDIGASDARPVDIIFIPILPGKDGNLNHVRLSRFSRLFKNQVLCARLREAANENEIFAAFLESEEGLMAA